MDMIIQLAAAFSAGAAVTCLSLCILRLLSGVELERKRAETDLPVPVLFRLLMPFLPLVRSTSESEGLASWRRSVAPKLLMAGYGEVFTPGDFIGLKLLVYLLGLVILLIGALSGRVLICLCMAALVVTFYSSMWLSMRIKARHLSIMKALPNVLDLLMLSVESGRDIVSALRDILARRRMDPLGEELTRAFRQMQLGRKRADALRDMAQRVRQHLETGWEPTLARSCRPRSWASASCSCCVCRGICSATNAFRWRRSWRTRRRSRSFSRWCSAFCRRC